MSEFISSNCHMQTYCIYSAIIGIFIILHPHCSTSFTELSEEDLLIHAIIRDIPVLSMGMTGRPTSSHLHCCQRSLRYSSSTVLLETKQNNTKTKQNKTKNKLLIHITIRGRPTSCTLLSEVDLHRPQWYQR